MIQLLFNKTTPHFQLFLCLRLTSPNYAFMRRCLYSKWKVKEYSMNALRAYAHIRLSTVVSVCELFMFVMFCWPLSTTQDNLICFLLMLYVLVNLDVQCFSGKVFDLRPKGCGFKPHRRHCVVSLSKTHESLLSTVKTLYNVTCYNRIFNIRHKIAGNGSVSIKIPSL